tara:strand:+ start:40 stop:714 length:675 start_codon:yes stop_codon:yes gene_type:complete
MKNNIAHIITLTSLCISIFSIIQSCYFNFRIGAYLILMSLILDGIDGTIARYLNTASNFGQQLDSLSDMIAFGLAPAILLYNFIGHELNNPTLSYLTLLIPVCSALRLANYNSHPVSDTFHGLTTPVSALMFVSIPLINEYEHNVFILNMIINESVIAAIIVIISILLISPLETFNLRIDSIKYNKRKLFFIFISICVLYLFNFTGLPLIILIYILLSKKKLIT